MANKPVTALSRRHASVTQGGRLSPARTWQERIRDPSLTVLLVLELCAVFFAAPLAAKGLPIARVVANTLVLAVLVVVVMLSPRPGAIILILLGLAATATSLLLSAEWSPVSLPCSATAAKFLPSPH